MSIADSLQGYDYQVDVTVWLALDLVVSRGLCEAIEIEPTATLEDVEAILALPADIKVQARDGCAEVELAKRHVQFQIKHHDAPWRDNEIADMVFGPKSEPGRRGPSRRPPPSEWLAGGAGRKYVLVTSAQVSAKLRALRDESVTVDPKPFAPLPGFLSNRSPAGGPTPDASQIRIIEQQTSALVHLKIRELLTSVGHVPAGRLAHCRNALRDAVWRRMRTKAGPRALSRLEVIDLIEVSGGRLDDASGKFVFPRQMDEISQALNDRFAVILTGPPGIGKTECAHYLGRTHGQREEPFETIDVRDSKDAERARAAIHPALLVVHDPFGRYEGDPCRFQPTALLELLRTATQTRRIVVTTPIATFEMVAGSVRPRLAPFVVELSDPYSRAQRERILDDLTVEKQLQPSQLEWVQYHKGSILDSLERPLELAILVDLLRGKRDAQSDVSAVLRECRSTAISARLADELRSMQGGIALAAVAWVLLTTTNLTRELVDAVHEELRSGRLRDLRLKHFVEWLRHHAQLGLRGGRYHLHPLNLQGLERAFQGKVHADIVEDVIAELIAALVRMDQTSLAIDVWRLAKEPVAPFGAHRCKFEEELQRRLVGATSEHEFSGAARAVLDWSEGRTPVEYAIRAVMAKPPRPHKWWMSTVWQNPPWDRSVWSEVAASVDARRVVGRFVAWRLGDNEQDRISYRHMAAFLQRLAWDLKVEFCEAFDRLVDRGLSADTDELVVSLACGDDADTFETLLDYAVREKIDIERRYREQDSEEWWDDFGEGPLYESFCSVQQALKSLFAYQRSKQGWKWIATHKYAEHLLRPWAAVIESEEKRRDPNVADVREIVGLVTLAAAYPEDASCAWRTAAAVPRQEFAQLAVLPFGIGGPAADVGILAILSRSLDETQFAARLHAFFEKLSHVERVEIFDAAVTRQQDFEGCNLMERLTNHSPATKHIVDLLHAPSGVAEDQSDIESLRTIALKGAMQLAVKAVVVLARNQQVSVRLAARLIDNGDDAARASVICAIANTTSPALRRRVRTMLTSAGPNSQRAAVGMLAPTASRSERDVIIGLAATTESGASLRMAVVEAIIAGHWKDGVPTLIDMLRDTSDWNRDRYSQEQEFRIARAAVEGLRNFLPLSQGNRERLEEFVLGGASTSPDWNVHKSVLALLAEHNDVGVVRTMQRLWTGSAGWDASKHWIRFDAGVSLVQHLRTFPERLGDVDFRLVTMLARHDIDWLALPALWMIGFAGDHAAGALSSALTDARTTANRQLAIIDGQLEAQRSRILVDVVGPAASGPVGRMLGFLAMRDADESFDLKAAVLESVEITEWLSKLDQDIGADWFAAHFVASRCGIELPNPPG